VWHWRIWTGTKKRSLLSRKLSKRDPATTGVGIDKGDALRQLERYQEAIASYDQALDRRPNDYWSWYRRGDALRNWGRLEEALTSYDRALDVEPADYWSWYQRGELLRQLRRYQEAVTSYDKALESEPEDEYALYNQACCYALLGMLN
jgi:tetratricopeptide (TPR) repeat protein